MKLFTSNLPIFFVLLYILPFIGCKESTKSKNENQIDLLKYGIPVSIAPPKDVEVTSIGQGGLTDVSIKNKTDYDVQVFMAAASTSDLETLKTNKKQIIRTNPVFSKIIEEYEDGFFYEKFVDENKTSFDFLVIKIIGSNEINFQCGNSKEFTEEDVRKMIASVKSVK